MLKRETTKNRLKKMLNEEREELTDATRAAALADLTHVAQEYFEAENPSLQVKKGKNGSEVLFSFRAVRAKNFTTLK